MAKFSYIAKKGDSETYRGTAVAKDRFELYAIVRKEGGTVVSVTEEGKGFNINLDFLGRIKEMEKILLARNLSAMLSAGLNLSRALAVLSRQTSNKKLADVLGEIDTSVRRGDAFNVALSHFPKVFSGLFIAMVRAGEESGELPGALQTVSEQSERMYDLKRKVKSAMIYPTIVLVAIVGIGILLMIEVVPTLAATFKAAHAKLPGATQAVINLSDALANNTLQTLSIMFGSVALVVFAFKTKKGTIVLDWITIHMPLIKGLTKEINAARTARTLASLIGARVDVIQSLSITKEVVQNSFFRAVIEDAIVAVNAGKPLSSTFSERTDLYPPFVGEMMSVGEETGATTDMLKRLALYYEDQVDRQTKDMSTIIEPFLMLFIGGAVGFFAVAMIMPIYQLTSTAG